MTCQEIVRLKTFRCDFGVFICERKLTQKNDIISLSEIRNISNNRSFARVMKVRQFWRVSSFNPYPNGHHGVFYREIFIRKVTFILVTFSLFSFRNPLLNMNIIFIFICNIILFLEFIKKFLSLQFRLCPYSRGTDPFTSIQYHKFIFG